MDQRWSYQRTQRWDDNWDSPRTRMQPTRRTMRMEEVYEDPRYNSYERGNSYDAKIDALTSAVDELAKAVEARWGKPQRMMEVDCEVSRYEGYDNRRGHFQPRQRGCYDNYPQRRQYGGYNSGYQSPQHDDFNYGNPYDDAHPPMDYGYMNDYYQPPPPPKEPTLEETMTSFMASTEAHTREWRSFHEESEARHSMWEKEMSILMHDIEIPVFTQLEEPESQSVTNQNDFQEEEAEVETVTTAPQEEEPAPIPIVHSPQLVQEKKKEDELPFEVNQEEMPISLHPAKMIEPIDVDCLRVYTKRNPTCWNVPPEKKVSQDDKPNKHEKPLDKGVTMELEASDELRATEGQKGSRRKTKRRQKKDQHTVLRDHTVVYVVKARPPSDSKLGNMLPFRNVRKFGPAQEPHHPP